jgi:uridine kinase
MIIAICGGTCSGKTTLTRDLLAAVAPECAIDLPHDAYYRNPEDLPPHFRTAPNYDHPDALDNELFRVHLEAIRTRQPIEQPTYDFTRHRRSPATRRIEPRPVLIVEGILLFADPLVRELCDVKLFVEVPPDIRLLRRLRRDTMERGRTIESVLEQYETTVRPMHEQFVEPHRQHADLIVNGTQPFAGAVALLAALIHARLQESSTPV